MLSHLEFVTGGGERVGEHPLGLTDRTVAFQKIGEFEVGVDVGRILREGLLEFGDPAAGHGGIVGLGRAAGLAAAGRAAHHAMPGNDRLLHRQPRDLPFRLLR